MPELTPIQQSFAAGEISPLARSRSDTDGYNAGLAEMLNMYPDPRGPAVARKGMKHIARSDGNDARIEALQISETEYYICLLTDLKLAINTTQGAIPGVNLVSNYDFSAGDTDWTTRASAKSTVTYAPADTHIAPYQPSESMLVNPDFDQDGTGWTIRLSDPDRSKVKFENGICTLSPRTQLTHYSGIAQEVSTDFVGEEHTVTIVVEPASELMNLQIGTAEADGTYLDVEIPGVPGAVTLTFTPLASPYWVTLTKNSTGLANANGIISSMDVAEPVTGHTAGIAQGVTTSQVGLSHSFRVEGSVVNGQSYRLLIGTSEGDGTYIDTQVGIDDYSDVFTPTAAGIWITIDADYPEIRPELIVERVIIAEPVPSGDNVEFDTPYTEQQLDEIHIVDSPSAGEMYYLHREHPPYKLTFNPETSVWTFEIVMFIDQPAAWTADNYPGTGYIYQGRLWLGGPREIFWGSKSGSYEDFGVSVPIVDSDSVEFTLEAYGAIRWMVGFKNLLIGTENGEHIVTSSGVGAGGGSVGDVITPDSIQIDRQSSYGSAQIQPLQVGDQVFYVSPDRRKIRGMQYAWTENNWLSRDITFYSEHITQGLIKSLTWAQNPNNLLLVTLHNGDMAVLRYERGENIYGWSLVEYSHDMKDTTSGTMIGFNEIVAVTQLVPGSIDLEFTGIDDSQFMDSWVEVYNATATTTITGLDYLEDHVVQVLTDGAVHPDRLVLNGVIELLWEANLVVAGLGYSKKIKTLPFDKGSPTGSGMMWNKGWSDIYVRFLSSTIPMINGERPPTRYPITPMDSRTPDMTQDVSVVNLGWDQYAQVEVEQDLPLDLIVAAIYGEIHQEKV